MQVLPLYEHYLARFYGARPRMAALSCRDQTEALVRDACGGVHMVVPYLPKDRYQTDFVVPNCRHAQRAWALERGFEAPESGWEIELLRRRIDDFKPDVLYMGEPVRYDARFVRKLADRPALVLGWRGADVPVGVDWRGYNAILSSLPALRSLAETLGAGEGLDFLPGVPAHVVAAVANMEKDTDVVFAGGASPSQHRRRLDMLEALARGADRHGYSLALYLSAPPQLITPAMRPYVRPPVFGLAMHKALARGRIVVDTRGAINLLDPEGKRLTDLARGHTANMRLFEGTAGGSLMLTDHLPGLGRIFEPGREIATYHDAGELVDKVLYYLERTREREAMARMGFARCRKDWSMEAAVTRFTAIIEARLAG
jgi:hypothetical protein